MAASKDGFDWPGLLLQVQGRAIRLVEQETTKSRQAEERQWLVEQLQPKLDLFSQKQLPGILTRDQLASNYTQSRADRGVVSTAAAPSTSSTAGGESPFGAHRTTRNT